MTNWVYGQVVHEAPAIHLFSAALVSDFKFVCHWVHCSSFSFTTAQNGVKDLSTACVLSLPGFSVWDFLLGCWETISPYVTEAALWRTKRWSVGIGDKVTGIEDAYRGWNGSVLMFHVSWALASEVKCWVSVYQASHLLPNLSGLCEWTRCSHSLLWETLFLTKNISLLSLVVALLVTSSTSLLTNVAKFVLIISV